MINLTGGENSKGRAVRELDSGGNMYKSVEREVVVFSTQRETIHKADVQITDKKKNLKCCNVFVSLTILCTIALDQSANSEQRRVETRSMGG